MGDELGGLLGTVLVLAVAKKILDEPRRMPPHRVPSAHPLFKKK